MEERPSCNGSPPDSNLVLADFFFWEVVAAVVLVLGNFLGSHVQILLGKRLVRLLRDLGVVLVQSKNIYGNRSWATTNTGGYPAGTIGFSWLLPF
jgi:hypothetical protein